MGSFKCHGVGKDRLLRIGNYKVQTLAMTLSDHNLFLSSFVYTFDILTKQSLVNVINL